MGCGGSKPKFGIDAHQKTCIDVLNKKPDLSKYKMDEDTLQNAEKAYKSNVFGGSIFLPVGSKTGKREKRNPLESEITDMQVNYLYGGGFYDIQNIRSDPEPLEQDQEEQDYYGDEGEERIEEYGPPEFWDVQMLVESVENMEELQNLKVLNESLVQPSKNLDKMKKAKTKNVTMDITDVSAKKRKISEKTIPYEDMEQALTGYGRIIKYQVYQEEEGLQAQNCQLTYIIEGKFKNGMMDGYCRLVDCQDGEVHVGYFKDDMPQGKYVRFSLDGEVQEQGIKEEDELVKDYDVQNFMTRVLK